MQFVQLFLKSIFKQWLNEICWSSVLFGIFILKQCVEFCLTSFGTAMYDCVTKAIEMFNFLPLINSSISIRLIFY